MSGVSRHADILRLVLISRRSSLVPDTRWSLPWSYGGLLVDYCCIYGISVPRGEG